MRYAYMYGRPWYCTRADQYCIARRSPFDCSGLMNDLVMDGECREMQEFRCSDDEALVVKNGSVNTSGEVEGDMTASDGHVENIGSSWRRCWRDQCSGLRALSLRAIKERHWFVREVFHLTRLAVPLVRLSIKIAINHQKVIFII